MHHSLLQHSTQLAAAAKAQFFLDSHSHGSRKKDIKTDISISIYFLGVFKKREGEFCNTFRNVSKGTFLNVEKGGGSRRGKNAATDLDDQQIRLRKDAMQGILAF